MFKLFVIVGALIIGVALIVYFWYKEKNIKTLLTAGDVLPLELVMGFSNNELIHRIKRYYKGNDKRISIEYADGKYLEIDTRHSKKYLLSRIESKQEFMIDKRYNPDENYVVKDYIRKIMHELWIDYAYRNNYKTIFWRDIGKRYSEGEISNSSYNEIYNRFYKYKFLDE